MIKQTNTFADPSPRAAVSLLVDDAAHQNGDQGHSLLAGLDIALTLFGALAGAYIGQQSGKALLGLVVGVCAGGIAVVLLEIWESQLRRRANHR